MRGRQSAYSTGTAQCAFLACAASCLLELHGRSLKGWEALSDCLVTADCRSKKGDSSPTNFSGLVLLVGIVLLVFHCSTQQHERRVSALVFPASNSFSTIFCFNSRPFQSNPGWFISHPRESEVCFIEFTLALLKLVSFPSNHSVTKLIGTQQKATTDQSLDTLL